jgi:hypothetical protein
MPAVLRPGLLDGVGIAFSGGAEAIAQRANELGASEGADVLVHAAGPDADPQRALDDAWDAIRAHMLPPERSGGLIVLIAPPPGGPNRTAARAGLENLARTLSIEWARYGIRTVAILPGDEPGPAAELVAFLASPAGAYYSGCAFTLR